MQSKLKSILCLGGTGCLGSHVLKVLKEHKITNIDHHTSLIPNVKNILLDPLQSPKSILTQIINNINKSRFNAIIVTAGGFIGGSIKSDTIIQDYQKMRDANLLPSLFAAHLATKYLNKKGIVIFSGAAAVYKEPLPHLIGYTLAKTAVHSLAKNLSVSQQVPEDTTVLTILPEIIDTPQNRKAMPKANFDEWSKPDQIAQIIKGWVQTQNRPKIGSFTILKVKNGIVVPQFV